MLSYSETLEATRPSAATRTTEPLQTGIDHCYLLDN